MELLAGIRNIPTTVSTMVVSCCKHVWKDHKPVLFTTIAIVSAVKLHRVIRCKKLRAKWDSAGANVVVVHGIGRGRTCPNISPFVLKLETYLRMAGIQYQYDSEEPIGPKGKMPWITLNGEDYADSQLIMEFLGKKFNKDFSSNLTSEEKAVGRAMFIMTDEHIFWGLVWWRLVRNPNSFFEVMTLPCFMHAYLPLIRRRLRHALWVQGLGRHSESELTEIIRKDIEALSLYLGNKPFLMGDAPCEVDCAVFGMMSQCVWATPRSPFESMLQNDHPNLLQYCLRMKEKFWPDWDKHLMK